MIKQSCVKVGGIYQHYSSPLKTYMVLGIGFDAESKGRSLEDLKRVIIYKSLYSIEGKTNLVWIRSEESFTSKVSIGDKIFPRFTLIDHLLSKL